MTTTALPNVRNADSEGTGPTLWWTATAWYAVVIPLDFSTILLCKKLHTSPTWTTFDLKLVPGDPMFLAGGVDPADEHYRAAVAVDTLGRIHVAGNKHGFQPLLSLGQNRRYVVSSVAGDITSMVDGSDRINPIADPTGTLTGFGYDVFSCLTDGTLIWSGGQQDREYPDGDYVLGRDTVAYKLPPGATNWQALTGDGQVATCDEVEGNGDPERAYGTVFVDVDPTTGGDVIMLVGTMQMAQLSSNTRRYWYVVLSRDGGATWATVAGEPVVMPMTLAQLLTFGAGALIDPLLVGANPADESVYLLSFGRPAFDATGHLVIPARAITVAGGAATTRRYRWSGAAWVRTAYTAGQLAMAYVRDRQDRLKRYHEVNGRIQQTDDATPSVGGRKIGGDVPTSFHPMPCPPLAIRGAIGLLVPNGDAPAVYTYGMGAVVLG